MSVLPAVLEDLRAVIPEYAKDTKLNLGAVLTTEELSERQRWGTALACAIATRHRVLGQAFLDAVGSILAESEVRAAQTAASVMAMNNIYYRFLHLLPDKGLADRPARLRMNGLRGHGVDEADFELWCLAVSALNGCGLCVESHYHHLLDKGIAPDVVLGAVRIASVLHALATVVPDRLVPA